MYTPTYGEYLCEYLLYTPTYSEYLCEYLLHTPTYSEYWCEYLLYTPTYSEYLISITYVLLKYYLCEYLLHTPTYSEYLCEYLLYTPTYGARRHTSCNHRVVCPSNCCCHQIYFYIQLYVWMKGTFQWVVALLYCNKYTQG